MSVSFIALFLKPYSELDPVFIKELNLCFLHSFIKLNVESKIDFFIFSKSF